MTTGAINPIPNGLRRDVSSRYLPAWNIWQTLSLGKPIKGTSMSQQDEKEIQPTAAMQQIVADLSTY